jgi:glycosyltransferase involved in cell wall biosynthesis
MASIVSGEGIQRGGSPTIAFLAPEIPALSATFVYEEMLGLERRGVDVVPVSVHFPIRPAHGKEDMVARVRYLYSGPKVKLVLAGLVRLPFFRGAPLALGWLLSDIWACGPFRRDTWKLVFQFLASVRLAGMLQKERCLHLHVHFAHVPAQIAMYASALSGVPFTIMAHANDIFERGLLLDRKAQRAVKMLTISEYNRAYLESIGVAPDKLAVLRCGVSFQTGLPGSEPRIADVYRIGTLGRLVEKKGVDVLIKAIALLKERPFRVELAIAGDGPLRAELEHLVASLGLNGTLHFEGNMPHDQVRTWMQGLDLFVLASKPDTNGDMDGIPVVLMEAMSQSIPVISTRLSGIPELILDGQTGLLANPGDPSDLAEQIDRLLAAPELRHRLVGQALEHVQREFGQAVNLDRLIGHLALAII